MTTAPSARPVDPDGSFVFPTTGELGELCRQLDWAATPLGPVRDWPAALRTAAALVLASPHPMILVWGPRLTQIYNDAARELLGSRHPAGLGQPLSECWAEIWEEIAPMYDRVLRQRDSVSFEDRPFHILRNGYAEEAYFTATLIPAPDDAGDVGGVLVLAVETTARVRAAQGREAAEALRLSEERLRRMVNVEGVGVLIFDESSGVVVDANDTFLRTFGYAREDVATGSLNWRRMTPPEYVAESERQLEKLAATGRIGPYEKEYLHKDGSRTWMLFAGSSLGDGTLAEYCIDISDRKRAEVELREAKEVAEKANRVKSQFLSTLSHELRTPLSAVVGFTELMQAGIAGPITDKQKDYLARISATAWHLTSIIDEILTFSRTEAGKERAVLADADVADIARGVVSMLTSQAQSHGLELRLHGADAPVRIMTEAGKLRQILLNLVGNALKFTRSGFIEVTLEREGDWVAFRVQDTGAGIPADKLEEIFEPFTQIDGSSTRETGGTGLGLTICRRLARLLGGDVTVESTLGEGSTFTVRLPAARKDETTLLA